MPASELVENSFLVPIDGTEACGHALKVACEAVKRAKGTLNLLYVIQVPRSLALDASLERELERAEGALERAERVVDSFGLKAAGDVVQARQAGHAIVDEAVERKVGVIVVGLPYRRPYGRFEVSGVASYVVEHAPSEVWLIRTPEPTAR